MVTEEGVTIMNKLIEENILYEMPGGNNLTYILSDGNKFSTTEYKVLHSLENGCLVKCMKLLYNGKIQFFYLTDKYKSLAKILTNVDADGFLQQNILIREAASLMKTAMEYL